MDRSDHSRLRPNSSGCCCPNRAEDTRGFRLVFYSPIATIESGASHCSEMGDDTDSADFGCRVASSDCALCEVPTHVSERQVACSWLVDGHSCGCASVEPVQILSYGASQFFLFARALWEWALGNPNRIRAGIRPTRDSGANPGGRPHARRCTN